MKFDELLEQYSYKLPEELIALTPSSPRDHAKLLIYNKKTKRIAHDIFLNLPNYLPPNAVLVFNKTKVIPSRIPVTKSTGAKLFLTYVETLGDTIRVMATKQLFEGNVLYITKHLSFTVVKDEAKYFLLKPSFPLSELFSVLHKYGKTQLPPYLSESKLSEHQLRDKYQTVFAQTSGSIAAPTASLHFTNRLIKKLKQKGITIEYVTLHVNLGTFAYLTQHHVETNKLHEEYYEIDSKTAVRLNKYKDWHRPIIAVGTTVVRTLESASISHQDIGTTDLFIREPYQFKIVDGIITNFHVPKSSLLMLVAAFIGRIQILKLYQDAIHKRYRFYSFGDGMLLL